MATFTDHLADAANILDAPYRLPAGEVLGLSREGRPIEGYRFGDPSGMRISLIGGCHADEPVGPRLLRHLVSYLDLVGEKHPWRQGFEWWIIPHVNPDGEARNRQWYSDDDEAYDPINYLRHVQRELPGDDIEFGFPRKDTHRGCRPENRAVYDWWRRNDQGFQLHVSLHGMAKAAGPWFLLDAAWRDNYEIIKRNCSEAVDHLGYTLHDIERLGEKGFYRLDRGFCTRPASERMREYFMARGDKEMAEKFLPSSMETVRRLSKDFTLTLVSELPLFITPGVGDELGPPDPKGKWWNEKIEAWHKAILQDDDGSAAGPVRVAMEEAGLTAMPVRDQMLLQWVFIASGVDQVMIRYFS